MNEDIRETFHMNIKKLLAAGLLIMMAQLMVAQVSNPFFDRLKDVKEAQFQNISEAMMSLVRDGLEGEDADSPYMKYVKSMKMLEFDVANTPAVLKAAREETAKLEKAGMTKIISVNEDDQESHIYITKKGNIISEIFLWGYDNEDGFTAVQLNGSFTESVLDSVLDGFK